jgi:hypothetical protein
MRNSMYDKKFIDILVKAGLLDEIRPAGSLPHPIYIPESLIGKKIIFRVESLVEFHFRRKKPFIKKVTYSAFILGVSTYEEVAVDPENLESVQLKDELKAKDSIMLVISPVKADKELVRALRVDHKGNVSLDSNSKEQVASFKIL